MITVVLPTMNEEKAIGPTIEAIKRCGLKNYEILVVDKSKDKTPAIAKKLGARVVRQNNKGKGNAMILGAKKAKGDILIFIDADQTYDIKRIPDLVKPILKEGYDMVVGTRKLIPGKNIPLLNFVGDKLLTILASLLYGRTKDLLTGFRAIKKSSFLDLDLKSEGFEIETEIFAKSHKKKLKIKEIETDYTRRAGESKLNPIKDGTRITKALFKFLWEKP